MLRRCISILLILATATLLNAQNVRSETNDDRDPVVRAPSNIPKKPVFRPSVDCSKAKSPLALSICGDQNAVAADWELTSAYLALYFSQEDAAQFRSEHVE